MALFEHVAELTVPRCSRSTLAAFTWFRMTAASSPAFSTIISQGLFDRASEDTDADV